MSETTLMRQIRLGLAPSGARLFRNNVGLGWVGKVEHRPGRVIILDPRPLHAGLCEGSSDLIGWVPRLIEPKDVGATLAVFTAIETKSVNGRKTQQQLAFLEAVDGAGGYAGAAYSLDDALRIARRF